MDPNDIGLAIRSFLSEDCPVCEAVKALKEDPFCDDCLAALPAHMLEAVTSRDTYLNAFGPAFRHLHPLRSKRSTDVTGQGANG